MRITFNYYFDKKRKVQIDKALPLGEIREILNKDFPNKQLKCEIKKEK